MYTTKNNFSDGRLTLKKEESANDNEIVKQLVIQIKDKQSIA